MLSQSFEATAATRLPHHPNQCKITPCLEKRASGPFDYDTFLAPDGDWMTLDDSSKSVPGYGGRHWSAGTLQPVSGLGGNSGVGGLLLHTCRSLLSPPSHHHPLSILPSDKDATLAAPHRIVTRGYGPGVWAEGRLLSSVQLPSRYRLGGSSWGAALETSRLSRQAEQPAVTRQGV